MLSTGLLPGQYYWSDAERVSVLVGSLCKWCINSNRACHRLTALSGTR
jgi:hypothetical protein